MTRYGYWAALLIYNRRMLDSLPYHLACTALVGLTVVSSAGCSFDVSGIGTDDPAPNADAGLPDAEVDAREPCIPDEAYCEGEVLMTCNSEGTGPVDEGDACEFICDTSQGMAQCLYASNAPTQVYSVCASGGPSLTPTSGTVTIAEPTPGVFEIQCSLGCGSGNSIPAAYVAPGEAVWFCLSSVDIPAAVSVVHTGGIDESIVWMVDGAVTIAGTVDLSGGNGEGANGGSNGPGGYAGVVRGNGAGIVGNGPCAGMGGGRVGVNGDHAAGAGGGGGFGSMGGAGGQGRDLANANTANGGIGGTACGAPELVPLVGGSSGGGGADGSCGGDCGWPSGGGGGALGISSRASIDITGSLVARGGDGYGQVSNPGGGRGGGGGGGAGGALLLEARTLTITGDLVVDGGNGGQSASGSGGAGASTTQETGTNGMSFVIPGDGGSGGGGGGGRVRLNTPDADFGCGDFVSPMAVCSRGRIPATITP